MIQVDPVAGNLKVAEFASNQKPFDKDKVEAAYKAALAADPKNFTALVRSGSFYASEAAGKKYDQAEKFARDAIKYEPNRGGGYALLV